MPEPPNDEAPRSEAGANSQVAQGAGLEHADESAPIVLPELPLSGQRAAFLGIRRSLSESELASPGVQRLILNELEQAETKCAELEQYVTKVHSSEIRATVAEVKLKDKNAFEILYSSALCIGAAIFGFAPTLRDNREAVFAAALGIALIIGAAVAKLFGR